MKKLRYYQDAAVRSFFDYTGNRGNHGKNPLIVMPTGSGKSLVIAHIINRILKYDNTKILMVTHRKELIVQNRDEIIENFDNDLFLDVGIYSAGLNSRDIDHRIICAGIQSIYQKADEIGPVDCIIVDEVHRVPPKKGGMYRKFFDDMMRINPKIVIAGLSATPFRMTTGLLTEGPDSLFDDICYTISLPELIDPGHYSNKDKKQYLCNIISKNAAEKTDLSGIKIRQGEFANNEMQEAFTASGKVQAAVKEMLEYTTDRNKVLIFTSGIEHCEQVAREIQKYYNRASAVQIRYIHSQKSNQENEYALKDFRNGEIKYLVNVDILTEGFNVPDIDCIVMLRATQSPGLYSQIVGRGLRMAPGKKDCLFLDFGENILRHGPIDMIEVKKARNGNYEVKTMPVKECPKCKELLPLATRTCPACGYEYPLSEFKHEKKASDLNVISKWKKPVEYEVEYIRYSRHDKPGKTPSMRVDYTVGNMKTISEWICIEHSGFAQKKALQWIKRRTDARVFTVDMLIDISGTFPRTSHILVDENERFPQIKGYKFAEEKENREIPF